MSSRKARVTRRQRIFKGRIFDFFQEEVLYHGKRMVRDVIRHPGAAVIVPLIAPQTLLLVRQYRHAVGRRLLELPAGTLKAGERPDVCARRELAEETGWWPKRLTRIGEFYAAPGYTDERLIVYLARDLRPQSAQQDEDEDVRPVRISLSGALAKIRSGAICDAKTIAGIFLARRFVG